MTAEDRKGMKDAGSSNVSHVPRKPLQCIDVTTPVIVTLSKSCSETIAMPTICSLIEHGFLSVFSMVGKCYILNKV